MVRGIIAAILVCFTSMGFAQNDCDEDIDEKAVKLVDKAKDRKKYGKEKRMEFLHAAIEEEEDYVEANFMLGNEVIKTAISRGNGYSAAIKYYEKVAQVCPDFHSDVYYWLGAIYLGKSDYQNAAKYQELFLNFQSDDMKKFNKKYETWLEETERDYKYAKFYADHYANPVPFDPLVVREVSTNESDEYLPLLSPDNEILMFTRRWEDKTPQRGSYIQSDKVKYIEKFSIAHYKEGKFEKGEPMPAPFNTDDDINYGGVSLSLNNRHMYLTICTPYITKGGERRKNCDIYRSNFEFGTNPVNKKEEWHWTEPENLGPNINTSDGWESQPSLSSDGKHLYFASWRADSKGIDIFMSEMGNDGEWLPAQNLGAPINTDKNDKSPFIHSDSKSLYYSSQGHMGFGGYDIYYVRQNDDGTWGEPVNIGYPINTSEDEHGFVVSTDGKKVYYSSEHIGTKRTRLNVLSFDLYKEARPEKVVLVKGNVDDKSGHPERKHVSLKNMTSKEVEEFDVETDGSFAAIMTVKPGDKVVMKVEGDDAAYNSRVVDVPTEEEEAEMEAGEKADPSPVSKPIAQKMDVVVEEEEVGKSYRIEDLYYETNSSEISEKSQVILEDFADYLNDNPAVKIAIYGHTDNVGNSEANLALSTDRAFSVKSFLEDLGVQSSRLSFKGFGDQKPVASNSSEEGRALNRRTEFVLLSK